MPEKTSMGDEMQGIRRLGLSGPAARRWLRCGISAAAFCLATGTAFAQGDQPPADQTAATQEGQQDESILITGSRIRVDGMQTPVPVTAVGAEALESMAPTTLIDGLSQLPVFYGNQTPNSTASWFERGGYGNLDLRGLGINRTLTLVNGRRVISSNAFGGVDVNVIPEALVRSVEVVTGGASAAYGTDAVAGVVNFLLETGFDGADAHFQGGISDRGDSENYEFSGTFGTRLGDRGHLIISAEMFDQDGVHSYEDRDWYQAWGTVPDATGMLLIRPQVVSRNATFDGLIFAPGSALNGLAFRPDGSYAPFQNGSPSFGTLGTPPARHSIAGGGDGDDLGGEVQTLYPDVERDSIFVYGDYEVADGLNLFAQYIRGSN